MVWQIHLIYSTRRNNTTIIIEQGMLQARQAYTNVFFQSIYSTLIIKIVFFYGLFEAHSFKTS